MVASKLKPSSGSPALQALADTPTLRRRPQQARSRETLARVLDAAERLLASEGAEALTTTRIAEAAGISVGSLYQYFPGKQAIVDALARRYMAEFEELMEELGRRAVDESWDDLAGKLLDAFADRYRSEPGYRALWMGRHLNDELYAADRANKEALAAVVRQVLVQRGLARDGARLRHACRAAVLTADALLQEAFRDDPGGQPALIEEAKAILRAYLDQVVARYAPPRGGSDR